MLYLTAAFLVIVAGWAVGVHYLAPETKDDNPVEELVEVVIKQETGIDIDLTPNSPEK